MCGQAERYLQAHNQRLSADSQRQQRECYNCGKLGHTKAECRNKGGGKEQRFKKCNMYGHLVEACRKELAGAIQVQYRCNTAVNRQKMVTQGPNMIEVYRQSKAIPSAEIIPPSILSATGSHHLGRFLTIFYPIIKHGKGNRYQLQIH